MKKDTAAAFYFDERYSVSLIDHSKLSKDNY